MYRRYDDIRDKLGEPLWHDEHGVPRYAPFAPNLCGVYDQVVALIEIVCQGCGRTFQVSASWSQTEAMHEWLSAKAAGSEPRTDFFKSPVLPTSTNPGFFHYGDAPHHALDIYGTCVGVTMTTDVVRIVELWRCDYAKQPHWQRLHEHEFTYPAPEPASAE